MDISDVNKIAIQKKMNTVAENLREKVSREASKVIKLRVEQDAQYWDLKTYVAGLEAEHERLQQNMLDAQMQHETLSATYQEEQRLRPEMLNRVASTREICNALEDYGSRMNMSVRRCAADRDALAQSYVSATQKVKAVLAQHNRNIEVANAKIEQLTVALNGSTKQYGQLESHAIEAQKQAEARDAGMRAQLSAAAAQLKDLERKCELMAQKNHSINAELIEQERTIVTLKQEKERSEAETKAEAAAAAALQDKLQKQLDIVSENLTASEARIEAAGKERARLLDLIAAAEQEAASLAEENKKLQGILQNSESTGTELKRELELSKAKRETLDKLIEEKECEIREYQARLEEMRRILVETRDSFNKTDSKLQSITEELEAERKARADENASAKKEIEAHKSRSAEASAALDRALAERTEAVEELQRQLNAETSARVRAEASNCATRAQLDLAAQLRDDLKNKLTAKEKELAVQTKIIMETRKEKDRLQETISTMQGKIDNIHKELSRDPPKAGAAAAGDAARREPPQHEDDNARDAIAFSPEQRVVSQDQDRGLVKRFPDNDSLYNFMSDSSVDNFSLRSIGSNACFKTMRRSEAEVPPPTPLNEIKRPRMLPAAAAEHKTEMTMTQARAKVVKANETYQGRFFNRNKTRLCDAKSKKSKK